HRRYGYDFSGYTRSCLLRALSKQLAVWKLQTISELIPLIIRSSLHFNSLMADLSMSVTGMFRNPEFYQALRDEVFPVLNSFPFFKIWHAGCSSGEEVYSLAILLQEAGLYESAIIYATDFNHRNLKVAKEGIYSRDSLTNYREAYIASGGNRELDDYFHFAYGRGVVKDELKSRITFAHHNLTCDGIFGEMEVILCRNVLIYFADTLKSRVLTLFGDSLYPGGFLCLGDKETLQKANTSRLFKAVNSNVKIFRKNWDEVHSLVDIPYH
ncbi:MAG: protein-glutamate O-methyltransferase CheR, partial [Pseudomonadales bacterium]|nr:protein-glutamate O-methyltransferase CheR [Pseudomonadales bacterium]